MNTHRLLHPLAGLFVLLTSLITYILCLEPSVSWWDCGEFITSAYRLEIGHPPGAPLFMLLGRFFTLFASGPEHIARMVNLMSALASAFTVLFLYLTIVLLVRRSADRQDSSGSTASPAAILAGIAGSLVYAFSDTFWYSAVEGEVYALSSLFTAAVFWSILRWDREADEPGNLRWILLIAFLVGLSTGVHLLNLLAVPAIVLFWYYRTSPAPTRKGTLTALAVSLGLLGGIMYILIPGVVTLASWFELFFVNLFRLPYQTGVIIFMVLLAGTLVWGIRETHRNQSVMANTILLSLVFLLAGYSTYSVIVIRSRANPPMDQNNPDNVFSLTSYLNREQYGNRPLIYGPVFNAPVTGQKPGKAVYGRVGGRYEIVDRAYSNTYDKRFMTFFPRMWNNSPEHVKIYREWAGIKGKPVVVKDENGNSRTEYRPTFTENLRFFFSYQLGHMYFRYFMWNFAGRQNDTESQGGIRNGNWITGIPFIDDARLGPQEMLPDHDLRNKSRNRYFLLPLLLGLAGAFYQYRKSRKDFWVVLLLFVFTGIAIVVYLNQYPNQPRERDYSYAGSFYAFAIWVGLGVGAFGRWVQKAGMGASGEGVPATGLGASRKGVPAFAGMTRASGKGAAAFAGMTGVLILGVPILMAVQNWDDHDRSGRYIARDFAFDYLNSCAPGAILFTGGDNDTFPLWYAQEVEGVRTDVRVICLPYLSADWYIDQLKRKAWLSDPVPFSLTRDQYGPGKRDYLPVIDQIKDTVDILALMNFVASDSLSSRLPLQTGGYLNYLPARNFRLAVDRGKVIANGTVPPEDSALIVSEMTWKTDRSALFKGDLMILDLIAHNNWERPVYFTSLNPENLLGLGSYFRNEGFAYRLVPVRSSADSGSEGSVNTKILYDRLMNTFRWGNINDKSVWIDSNTYRTTLITGIRQKFADLADALIREGKPDSARAVADRVTGLLPAENFPNDEQTAGLAEIYYRTGAPKKANILLKGFISDIGQDLRYIISVENKSGAVLSGEAQVNIYLLGEIRRLAGAYSQPGLVEEIDRLIDQLGIPST